MRELAVDNFAGGGGASTGIRMALGRDVDIAINHDAAAIAMHKANHPATHHYCEDIFSVSPRKACGGKPVGMAWFSPDCTHFSKARGGKPVEKKIRALAWVVVRWAKEVRPRVIFLENVEEFQTWGPVGEDDQPIKELAGTTFNEFVRQLRALGYAVEWRVLVACDYGAPTSRKRFVLIARCDGQRIVWPEPTHGDPERLEVAGGLLKPWRSAAEITDFSLPCPSIFATREEIWEQYGIRAQRPLSEKTMRRIAQGVIRFVIENPKPFIVPDAISFVTQYHGMKSGNDVRGQSLKAPLLTVDSANRYGLVSAFIHKYYDGGYKGNGSSLDRPLGTVTSWDHNSLCAAYITKLKGQNLGQPMASPLQTVTAGGNHFGQVRAFLLKYYGTGDGCAMSEPMPTITTKDRFGLVMVHGEPYAITDIGLRMYKPRELFDAQGFPEDYVIDRDVDGRPIPQQEQTDKCGNSVCPPLAEALVKANVPEMCEGVAA